MSIWDEVFTYDALAHAMAGTAGGQISMTLFFPLDHIRTYLQVNGDKNKVKKKFFFIQFNSKKSTIENIQDLIEKEGKSINFVFIINNQDFHHFIVV